MKVAVAGNPNVGKTSLFNVLTGARHRVGNYPGVTVERREGKSSAKYGDSIVLVDLPGIYSLTAVSDDERVAFAELQGTHGERPDAVLLVLDATNLARNLYFAMQVMELGIPVVVALNMTDLAESTGVAVDPVQLARELGVPVVATVARTGRGAAEVLDALRGAAKKASHCGVEPSAEASSQRAWREAMATRGEIDQGRAHWVLITASAIGSELEHVRPDERQWLDDLGDQAIDEAAQAIITARYAWIDELLARVGLTPSMDELSTMALSKRVDAVLTHPIFGTGAFLAIMSFVFVAIFAWADPVMELLESLMSTCASAVGSLLGPGLFTDLVTEGVIAGAGNVIVFVPQIALLFLFIGLLEDSGYLSRAAFLLDRTMSRVGLHGNAFIPLLSGYACAIPAILGTRTISNFKDRLVTILMIPYMSCSARLPIYALVIGALFVDVSSVERGLILLSMYALSTVSALFIGFIYKRTLLRSPVPPLVLELPPYRWPKMGNVALQVADRTGDFLKTAGTVIVAFTIILWAALSFPREATGAGQEGPTQIAQSYGGRLARTIEPVLEPIGQDWRVGVGIIGSFAAREVLVSTLGLVYGMEAEDDDAVELREAIRNDKDPVTGQPRHTRASGLALMIFFVYACMCMSTLAVARRETRSVRWPIFMFMSMTVIAYFMAFVGYRLALTIGLG